MKTILQALQDEIHYPMPIGYLENRMLIRGLDGNDECSVEILSSNAFLGCVADCIKSLVLLPEVREGDKVVKIADKDALLAYAKALYNRIGEEEEENGLVPLVEIMSNDRF